MDWKRLIKSIGAALLIVFVFAALIFIMVYGRTHPWVVFTFIGLALFAVLVGKIYDSDMK